MAKALVTWNSIKMFNEDGAVLYEKIVEFDEPKENLEPHPEGTCWYPILGRYLPVDLIATPMLVDESELVLDGGGDEDNESPRRSPPPADSFAPIDVENGDIVEDQHNKSELGEVKDEELVASTEMVFVRLRPKFYKGEKNNPYGGIVDPLPSPQELAKHYFWYWESTLHRDPDSAVRQGIRILFNEYRELERFVKVVDSIKAADAPLEEKAFVAYAFAGTMKWAAELTWEENANAVDWLCYFTEPCEENVHPYEGRGDLFMSNAEYFAAVKAAEKEHPLPLLPDESDSESKSQEMIKEYAKEYIKLTKGLRERRRLGCCKAFAEWVKGGCRSTRPEDMNDIDIREDCLYDSVTDL